MIVAKWTTFITGAFFLLAMGAVTSNSTASELASALILIPAASLLMGAVQARGLTISAAVAEISHEEAPVRLVYTVQNRWPLARTNLAVSPVIGSSGATVVLPARIADVGARASSTGTAELANVPRGIHHFDTSVLETSDPLGLYLHRTAVAAPVKVAVAPAPRTLNGDMEIGARSAGGGGVELGRSGGDGIEAGGIREYVPGDPLRAIHWRKTAQAGKLLVVDRPTADRSDVAIMLDCCASNTAADRAEFEDAVRFAAALVRRMAALSIRFAFVLSNSADGLEVARDEASASVLLTAVEAGEAAAVGGAIAALTEFGTIEGLLLVTHNPQSLAAFRLSAEIDSSRISVACVRPSQDRRQIALESLAGQGSRVYAASPTASNSFVITPCEKP